MDELTEVFGSKDLAEAYAMGLRAGLLVDSDFDYSVTTVEEVTGEWTVTVEHECQRDRRYGEFLRG